jgi:hypothetical protein
MFLYLFWYILFLPLLFSPPFVVIWRFRRSSKVKDDKASISKRTLTAVCASSGALIFAFFYISRPDRGLNSSEALATMLLPILFAFVSNTAMTILGSLVWWISAKLGAVC